MLIDTVKFQDLAVPLQNRDISPKETLVVVTCASAFGQQRTFSVELKYLSICEFIFLGYSGDWLLNSKPNMADV
jgi:hypothetical protein